MSLTLQARPAGNHYKKLGQKRKRLNRRLLPAVMRKRLVRFGHAMNVFLLLHRRSTTICGIQQFSGQLVNHALFATSTPVTHEPTNSQRGAALRENLDGNLIVCSADTARLDFEQRLAVLDRLLEKLKGFVATLLLKVGHGSVEDSLRRRLLASPHHGVDKLRHQCGTVYGIRSNFTLRDVTFSGHSSLLSCLPPAPDFSRAGLGCDPKSGHETLFSSSLG